MSTTTTPTGSPSRLDAVRTWLDDARRWTRPVVLANLVAQIGIIVTGGAVRLTGSGLGCSDWPFCEPGEFTPRFHDEMTFHPLVEFGNRTLTGVLLVVALAVAVLVWRDRSRSASYRRLGLLPLVGVLVQAVIGGITVHVDLHPAIVGGHLLISMALVAASAVLLERVSEGDGPPRPLATAGTRGAAVALQVALVPVLVLGVIVTGAGPHSGDSEIGYRFAVDPAQFTRFHAAAVYVFLAVVVLTVVLVARTRPRPPRARRVLVVLLVVTLVQGAIGYVQYFTGLPELLVGFHMLGAALLTAGTVRVPLALRERL